MNPADRIGSYRLINRLAHGGMGEVWAAEGPAGKVAIKIIPEFLLGDRLLVDRGLVESREQAARHIMAGEVLVDGKRVDKAGALVAQEDMRSWGYGAEIAARIADELFEHLDAPVRRIGALDTFVGYNPALENAILPQVGDLFAAMRELKEY